MASGTQNPVDPTSRTSVAAGWMVASVSSKSPSSRVTLSPSSSVSAGSPVSSASASASEVRRRLHQHHRRQEARRRQRLQFFLLTSTTARWRNHQQRHQCETLPSRGRVCRHVGRSLNTASTIWRKYRRTSGSMRSISWPCLVVGERLLVACC